MSAPDQASFTVAVKRGGEEGWIATAVYAVEGPAHTIEHCDAENVFEATYNALAAVMVRLGYDDEDESVRLPEDRS